MDCFYRLGVAVVLGLGLLVGCNKSSAPEVATAGSAGGNEPPLVVNETDPNANPIAKAAYDFLDAVLKGDTQRASARLTPQAMQRIVASGKQFSPPGLEKATFKIGEVRSPSDSQAIVQCVLTDSTDGTPHSEEMCCLLRKVENEWRISGIAYGTAPDKPWTLSDFESGQNMGIPRQTMGGMASTQGTGGQPGTAQPNASPQGPVGMPQVGGPANNQNAGAPAGLGMPSVGQQSPYPSVGQQQPPYTAQEPQNSERR